MHFVIPSTNAVTGDPVNMDLIESFEKIEMENNDQSSQDALIHCIRFSKSGNLYLWTYALEQDRDAEYDRICRHCNIITLSKQVF